MVYQIGIIGVHFYIITPELDKPATLEDKEPLGLNEEPAGAGIPAVKAEAVNPGGAPGP
jgi:hypothetical protein